MALPRWREKKVKILGLVSAQRLSFAPELPTIAETFPGYDLGIWQSWSWSQVADEVRALACGLAAQGFRRGMNLAIIGDNRPRLYWAIAAAQALGGIPVPAYQDSIADEMAYVLENAEVRFAIDHDGSTVTTRG